MPQLMVTRNYMIVTFINKIMVYVLQGPLHIFNVNWYGDNTFIAHHSNDFKMTINGDDIVGYFTFNTIITVKSIVRVIKIPSS